MSLLCHSNGKDLGPAVVEGLQGLTLYPTFSLYNKDDQLRMLPFTFTSARGTMHGSPVDTEQVCLTVHRDCISTRRHRVRVYWRVHCINC